MLPEELPSFEAYRQSHKFYNGKINYGLLVRFLRGRVGEDWAGLQVEIEARIPTRLKEYRQCVAWFVADKVEWRDGGLWDRERLRFHYLDPEEAFDWSRHTRIEFYVDPDTQTLRRSPDGSSERQTRGMSRGEVRAFREGEQRARLARRRPDEREVCGA